MKICKDCKGQVGKPRPAPYPGPRCATHHRQVTRERKTRAHDRRVQAVYGLNQGQYAALYELQGGRCAILGCRATGKSKRLAVDHDHACCPGPTSCGKCVRGLLCSTHNQQLGENRDNPAVFRAIADYLECPPTRVIVG